MPELLKDRESQVDDDGDQGAAGDDSPALDVRTDGDSTTVTPSGGSKAEERRRKWSERVRGVISEVNKPVEDRLGHMQRTLEGLQGAIERARTMAPGQQPPQQAAGGSRVDPEFMKIRRRQSDIMSLLKSATTQKEIDDLQDEYYGLDQDAVDARARKLSEGALQTFQQRNPPQPSHEQQMVTSKFGDVIANQPAAQWAALKFREAEMEASNTGQPFDRMATHERVLQEAGERFKIRRPKLPPADPSTQARFGGAPPASGRGNSSRGPGRPLTKAEEGLAIASSPPGTSVSDAVSSWASHMLKRDPHYFG